MMYDYEKKLWSEGYNLIAGCDEVGRGPMAGPVVVASVILDKDVIIEGLNDKNPIIDGIIKIKVYNVKIFKNFLYKKIFC